MRGQFVGSIVSFIQFSLFSWNIVRCACDCSNSLFGVKYSWLWVVVFGVVWFLGGACVVDARVVAVVRAQEFCDQNSRC